MLDVKGWTNRWIVGFHIMRAAQRVLRYWLSLKFAPRNSTPKLKASNLLPSRLITHIGALLFGALFQITLEIVTITCI